MSVAWVGVAVSAAGVVSANQSSSKARKAQQQQADAQMAQAERALDAQVKQADDVLAFSKQVYEEGRARQVNLDAVANKVVNMQMGIAQQQADRATESYNFYKTQGRPMVERAFQDANGYDSEENLAAARGRAAATVEQSFNNVQGQQQRALQRMGINPNSGKFLALQQRLAAEKSLATTGAVNAADEQRRAGAVQLRQNAGNLAQGFPAQVNGQAGSSTAAGNSAVGANASIGGQNLALAGQALNGMSTAGGMYGSVANGYANLFGQSSANANAIGARSTSDMQGWGNLMGFSLSQASKGWGGGSNLGGFMSSAGDGYGSSMPSDFQSGGGYNVGGAGAGMANGGQVRGPGTGTSDSVPAVNGDSGQPIMLSNGEYIISADVVKAKGVEFFDRLQKKHHAPVKTRSNLGRVVR